MMSRPESESLGSAQFKVLNPEDAPTGLTSCLLQRLWELATAIGNVKIVPKSRENLVILCIRIANNELAPGAPAFDSLLVARTLKASDQEEETLDTYSQFLLANGIIVVWEKSVTAAETERVIAKIEKLGLTTGRRPPGVSLH